MAQTSSVYDPETDEDRLHHDAPSDDELRSLTGIDKDEEAAMGNRAQAGLPGDKRPGRFSPSRLLSPQSAFRKRVAIAAAVAGGSIVVGILAFLALLPLKIEHMIKNLEKHYFSSMNNALDKTTENEFNRYLAKQMLPNFFTRGNCTSSISAGCVTVPKGTGPVDRLYQSWAHGRIEERMATKYGILLGKKGGKNGQLYMNIGGKTLKESELKDIMGGKYTLFNVPGTSSATRAEIRSAVREGIKGATLYDKAYFRFKLGPFLSAKYGIKRCVIACNTRDKFTDSVAIKKQAAKAYIVQRVVGPFSESASLALQCLLSGTCSTDNISASGDPTDPEKTSSFQKQLNGQLTDFAAKYGEEKLAGLVANAEGLQKEGVSKFIFKKVVTKVIGSEAAGDAAGSVADGVGFINFIAKIVSFVNGASSNVKKMNYAIGAAAAVQTYMTFRTVADEVHSGPMDPTELGSLTSQLSNGGVDATSTPVYASVIGGGTSQPTTTGFLNNIFPSAYAASADTAQAAGTYLCKDGKPVPAGQSACDEEKFDGGSKAADALTNIARSIPGWGLLSDIASVWNSTIGRVFSYFSSLTSFIVSHLGFSSITSVISSAFAPIFSVVTDHLINNPLQDAVTAAGSVTPGGGRTFDMMAAGADVSGNKSCHVQLGCAQITPTQAAEIQNEQTQYDKLAFDRQPLFARLFSTDSQYSLVARLSMSMPSDLGSATSSFFANLVSNPFSKLASSFSALLIGDRVFAAQPAQADPFGVTQYGYMPGQIPSDPQAYWDKNCQGDISTSWFDSQQQSQDTGEPVATTTNACLLIQSSAQSAGGLFDSSMLPAGSQNP